MPEEKEQLIIAKISGPTVWNTAFKNQVGRQSEGQEEDFESTTMHSKVDKEISLK